MPVLLTAQCSVGQRLVLVLPLRSVGEVRVVLEYQAGVKC